LLLCTVAEGIEKLDGAESACPALLLTAVLLLESLVGTLPDEDEDDDDDDDDDEGVTLGTFVTVSESGDSLEGAEEGPKPDAPRLLAALLPAVPLVAPGRTAGRELEKAGCDAGGSVRPLTDRVWTIVDPLFPGTGALSNCRRRTCDPSP
jgi:hypothetical protein